MKPTPRLRLFKTPINLIIPNSNSNISNNNASSPAERRERGEQVVRRVGGEVRGPERMVLRRAMQSVKSRDWVAWARIVGNDGQKGLEIGSEGDLLQRQKQQQGQQPPQTTLREQPRRQGYQQRQVAILPLAHSLLKDPDPDPDSAADIPVGRVKRMGRSRRRRSDLKLGPGPSEVGVEVGNDLTKDKAATERSHTEETSSSVSGLAPQQATAVIEEPQETPPQITTTIITTTTEQSQPQPSSPGAPLLTTHRLTLAPHPNTDLFSPAPPPGTLLILTCSAQADWGDGVSKFLRTHFPEAYEVYRSHCTSIPTTTTTAASPSPSPSSSQTDLHASHSQDQDSESVSDPIQVRKARENALLDKHQRSLVGTALLIRSAPSSVSVSAAPHNDDNDDNAAANKQRKHRKHFKYFIGCLFVSSKEGPTTSEEAKAYGDPPSPPVAGAVILKAMRTAMADLMGQVAEHNLKAAEWEREREKNGDGGERKRKKRNSAVVGPEMRLAKWDDVSTTKFGVEWEMIEEGLEGLEVKVAEGMLPGEGGEISLGVFDEVVEGGTKTEKEKGMLPGEGGEISLRVFDEVVEGGTMTEKEKGKAKGKKRETNSKRKRKYWALPGPKKSKK